MQHVGILGFFSMPGGMEWLIILFVALLIFGRRLPSLMRSLGGSVREFKKGVNTDDTDADPEDDGPSERKRRPDGKTDDETADAGAEDSAEDR